MGAIHGVVAARQAIPLVQRAHRGTSRGGQPRLDQPVLLDGEALPGQHLPQDLVVAVHLQLDGFQSQLGAVSEAALDDVGHPVRSSVRHHERVQGHVLAPVGCDHRGFRAILPIEPEQLTKLVSRARVAPPPLQVGGFIEPFGGVSAADTLEERGRSFEIVETDPMPFAPCFRGSGAPGSRTSPAPCPLR